MKKPTPEMQELLRNSVSQNPQIAIAAYTQLAKALAPVLRKGVMQGDNLGNIYERVYFPPGVAPEYPLDFVSPGSEKNFFAYLLPGQGEIPQRHISGSMIMIPLFEVASSIDWTLKYSRDARWDIVSRALSVLEATFIKFRNDSGWRTILAAAAGRNLAVFDDAATAGLFTKRVVALAKTIMRRNAGGNVSSQNKGKLTDIALSPELLEDIRSWDLTQVDDFTRREIFLAGGEEGALTRIFGVNLRDVDEFGVGQPYQKYFTSTLAGSMSGGKLEIMVGLDLSQNPNDSFVQPWREELSIFEDPTMHRARKAGVYAWEEYGFAILDARRALLLMA